MQAVLMQRAGKDVHDFKYEWLHTLNLNYGLMEDVEIGAQFGYRQLRSIFVDDIRPAFVGSEDRPSDGVSDMQLSGRWRLMHDPFELYVLAGVGIPIGQTNNHDLLGRRYEPEFQPCSGGWSSSVGFGLAKSWGPLSGRFEAQETLRFEGQHEYKFGDVTALRLGASYQLPLPSSLPPVTVSSDLLTTFYEPDVDHGETIGAHRAKLLFWVPGISFEPIHGLSVNITAPLPVMQNWAQHQKIDYAVQISIAYTFSLLGR